MFATSYSMCSAVHSLGERNSLSQSALATDSATRDSDAAIAFCREKPIESMLAAAVAVGAQRNHRHPHSESDLGTRKSGKGRRKLGRKKRRMRAKIRHRKK
jgi:hypothetical protein